MGRAYQKVAFVCWVGAGAQMGAPGQFPACVRGRLGPCRGMAAVQARAQPARCAALNVCMGALVSSVCQLVLVLGAVAIEGRARGEAPDALPLPSTS